MIDHDRHRRVQNQVLDSRHYRQAGIDLNVPAGALHETAQRLKSAPAGIGVALAGAQIQADAAHAGSVHGVQIARRRLFVDHRHAAGVRASRLHPV